jgi:hypothetical protein
MDWYDYGTSATLVVPPLHWGIVVFQYTQ